MRFRFAMEIDDGGWQGEALLLQKGHGSAVSRKPSHPTHCRSGNDTPRTTLPAALPVRLMLTIAAREEAPGTTGEGSCWPNGCGGAMRKCEALTWSTTQGAFSSLVRGWLQ